jgi:hypothetical protein
MDERGRFAVNCPYCHALIHPDSVSCFSCGRYLRMPAERTQQDRLQEWKTLADTPEQLIVPTQHAGDQGELWLQTLLGPYTHYKDTHLFTSKRIPEPHAHRRQELDVIVVTPKRLYVFEVKNWSGQLYQRQDQWIQVNRSGKEIVHKDYIHAHRAKTDVLLRYLWSRNIQVPISNVSQKIIFANARLEIPDDAILHHPDVIHLSKLRSRLTAQTIIDYCLAHEQDNLLLSSLFEADIQRLFPQIVTALQHIGTWDQLYLYGGAMYKGDIRHLRIGDEVFFRERFESGWRLELQWARSEEGLLRTLLKLDVGTMRFPDGREQSIGVDDTILFHTVGEHDPTRIPLKAIDSIHIG